MTQTGTIHAALTWLHDTPLGLVMRENWLLFPLVESIHVLALTFVFGSIAMVDLRLLGLLGRSERVTRISEDILPFTWAAFGVAAVSGGMMFVSNAVKYFENGPFRLKMALLLLAGLNMAAFQFGTYRGVKSWNEGKTPLAAKIAAGLSLALWAAIIAAGRWIGFTTFG